VSRRSRQLPGRSRSGPWATSLSQTSGASAPSGCKTRWRIGIGPAAYPIPKVGELEGYVTEGRPEPTIIAPGADVGAPFAMARALTDSEREQVRAGSLAFYVFGDVCYDDIFSEHHHCVFRLVINSRAISIGVHWIFAPNGNSCDQGDPPNMMGEGWPGQPILHRTVRK
jgi:hypothetical protein